MQLGLSVPGVDRYWERKKAQARSIFNGCPQECGLEEWAWRTRWSHMASLIAGGCRKHIGVSEESQSAQERKSQLKYLPSPEAQRVKCLPAVWEARVWSLSWEDPLEKKMATHSSTVAWKILWTEEPGRLQSMGSLRVGHDWSDLVAAAAKRSYRSS